MRNLSGRINSRKAYHVGKLFVTGNGNSNGGCLAGGDTFYGQDTELRRVEKVQPHPDSLKAASAMIKKFRVVRNKAGEFKPTAPRKPCKTLRRESYDILDD